MNTAQFCSVLIIVLQALQAIACGALLAHFTPVPDWLCYAAGIALSFFSIVGLPVAYYGAVSVWGWESGVAIGIAFFMFAAGVFLRLMIRTHHRLVAERSGGPPPPPPSAAAAIRDELGFRPRHPPAPPEPKQPHETGSNE
jgi:hypothetical protein